MAPDTKIKSRETTTGAVFTTVSWIIATEIYSFYVNYFAKYNLLYGSVANLLILFLWIYLLSYIVFIFIHYYQQQSKKKCVSKSDT